MASIFAFFLFSPTFRGEKITILYDPGMFPALGTKNERRNGGVPQEGNLTKHLDIYRAHIDELVRHLLTMLMSLIHMLACYI